MEWIQLARWIARRDDDAAQSKWSGWLRGFRDPALVVAAIYLPISVPLIIAGLPVACWLLAYADLHRVGWTAYCREYGSYNTPSLVRVIDEDTWSRRDKKSWL